MLFVQPEGEFAAPQSSFIFFVNLVWRQVTFGKLAKN